MPAYCTQADLEIAVGGAKILRELSDPNKTGSIVSSWVTDYLESGAAEIRTAVEVKHDPETIENLDADSKRRLKDANAALSARIAYTKGGQGHAMPEWVSQAADRAETFLEKLATGTRRLGRVNGGTKAAINQPVGVVDFDSSGSGMSVAGFKRGFR